MPYTSCTPYLSIMPSSTISLPPPPPSSAGWNITTTVPSKLRVSARYFAAPSSIAVCPSCPQACIFPSTLDECATPLVSNIGKASISARIAITLPDVFCLPLITPTTPVRPTPVSMLSRPNSFSLSATTPAVRCTSNSNSGFSCKSRRQAVISACISANRLIFGMLFSELFDDITDEFLTRIKLFDCDEFIRLMGLFN